MHSCNPFLQPFLPLLFLSLLLSNLALTVHGVISCLCQHHAFGPIAYFPSLLLREEERCETLILLHSLPHLADSNSPFSSIPLAPCLYLSHCLHDREFPQLSFPSAIELVHSCKKETERPIHTLPLSQFIRADLSLLRFFPLSYITFARNVL
jgi:hypothetical protein